MKTLTKFILITASVLSLVGCSGEDDKSYTEDSNVAPRATAKGSVTCPSLGLVMNNVEVAPRIVNNTYKVLTSEGDELILPVNECYIEN